MRYFFKTCSAIKQGNIIFNSKDPNFWFRINGGISHQQDTLQFRKKSVNNDIFAPAIDLLRK